MEQDNNQMVINFEDYVQETMQHDSECEQFLQYNEHYGSLEDTALEDTEFYKNYLSRFDLTGIKVIGPKRNMLKFDPELLTRFILGSYACDYHLELDEDWMKNPKGTPLFNLVLNVGGEDSLGCLKDLWSYQALGIFSACIDEQVAASIKLAEGGEDAERVTEKREKYIDLFEKRKKMLLAKALVQILKTKITKEE